MRLVRKMAVNGHRRQIGFGRNFSNGHGMRDGTFAPPSFELDKDYQGLQALVKEDREGVSSFSEQDASSLAGKSLVFDLGKNKTPFTNENFLLTFSLPNFYFHATTTYDILRMLGVPLGKMNLLGAMKIG